MTNPYDEMSVEDRAEFDEWLHEIIASEVPTEDDINQMCLFDFYDFAESSFDESDVTYQRALEVYQRLEQLQDLYKLNLFTDVTRFEQACRVMATRVDNLNYDFDSYAYHDNMDDYVTIDAARADEVNRLVQEFQAGDIEKTMIFVSDLAQELDPSLENLIAQSERVRKELMLENEMKAKETKGMDKMERWSQMALSEVIPDVIAQDERITPELVDMLNERIVTQYQQLQQGAIDVKNAWEDAQYTLYTVARGREEEGFDANEANIPWYLEQKLGTSATVDELTDEMNEKEQVVESYHDDYVKPFFKDVYDLQHYNFDGVGAHVTGIRRDGSKDTPVLISSHTVKALGSEYEAFAKEYFHEQLEAIKNRNVGKKGLFGIDVSKSANGATSLQSTTQSMTKQTDVDYTIDKTEPVVEKMQVEDGTEVVQRQLPRGFDVHNVATAEDDNSFDEYDSEDDTGLCD